MEELFKAIGPKRALLFVLVVVGVLLLCMKRVEWEARQSAKVEQSK